MCTIIVQFSYSSVNLFCCHVNVIPNINKIDFKYILIKKKKND